MIVRVGQEHRGGLVGIGVVGDDHFEVTRLRKGGFEYVRQERASLPRWDEDREFHVCDSLTIRRHVG